MAACLGATTFVGTAIRRWELLRQSRPLHRCRAGSHSSCSCIHAHTHPHTRAQVLELLEGGHFTDAMLDKYRGRIDRIKRVCAALESALLRLDDMIALFNDF